MLALAVKLILAPAFVVGASLTARRFGMLVGGLVGGLPVVAAPILLAFALDQSAHFAAQAAVGTVLGLVSLTTFMVAYAWLATIARWPLCLLGGWLAFLAMTALLSPLHVGAVVALVLALASFAIGLRLLPRAPLPPAGQLPPIPPRWDLPARAVSVMVLVVTLTAVAATLGPHLSGLLAPFPIITGILSSFTHAHSGVAAAHRIQRGMVLGLTAFALCCFTIAVAVDPLGIAPGFLLGVALSVLVQLGVLRYVTLPRVVAR